MGEEKWNDTMDKRQTNVLVVGTALAVAVLGALLLFVPQISLEKICYVMCSIIVIGGVYSIVKYFLSSAYKEAQDYGFSAGVFLVVLGIVGFVKTAAIVSFFPVALSIIGLLYGVILLQDALDLKRLKGEIYMVVMGEAMVTILSATIILLNPFSVEMQRTLSYWLILVIGIFIVISKILLKIAYKKTGEETEISL